MDAREEQLERFREAVDEKGERSRAASEATGGERSGPPPASAPFDAEQRERVEAGRPQDERSIRDKNAGKGKKTADKWNQ